MKEIKKHEIRLSEYLDEYSYSDINELYNICKEFDKTELKLELDYKFGKTATNASKMNCVNEFLYYYDNILVGYLGICYFGGEALEVNGMVHPQYRRMGIFTKLYSLLQDEFRRRNVQKMLLLSDVKSTSGLNFIRSLQADHEHSEYEMYMKNPVENFQLEGRVLLRKANYCDAREITYQNSIYFDTELDENDMIIPEDEEKCGMEIFIAEEANKIIGKIHLETNSGVGAIFGLGVLPEYRGRGFGREILKAGVTKLQKKNVSNIKLQVSVKNENALGLYKSCGFEVTSTMEYYQILK